MGKFRDFQFVREGGVFVLHWQPTSGAVSDWKDWCLACNDTALADPRRCADHFF
jgi:hypothetical protein